jgi:hypothetical protein
VYGAARTYRDDVLFNVRMYAEEGGAGMKQSEEFGAYVLYFQTRTITP